MTEQDQLPRNVITRTIKNEEDITTLSEYLEILVNLTNEIEIILSFSITAPDFEDEVPKPDD